MARVVTLAVVEGYSLQSSRTGRIARSLSVASIFFGMAPSSVTHKEAAQSPGARGTSPLRPSDWVVHGVEVGVGALAVATRKRDGPASGTGVAAQVFARLRIRVSDVHPSRRSALLPRVWSCMRPRGKGIVHAAGSVDAVVWSANDRTGFGRQRSDVRQDRDSDGVVPRLGCDDHGLPRGRVVKIRWDDEQVQPRATTAAAGHPHQVGVQSQVPAKPNDPPIGWKPAGRWFPVVSVVCHAGNEDALMTQNCDQRGEFDRQFARARPPCPVQGRGGSVRRFEECQAHWQLDVVSGDPSSDAWRCVLGCHGHERTRWGAHSVTLLR